MDKYILIYAYTNFSKGELNYWNDLSDLLKKKGFKLLILAPIYPNGKYKFLCHKFTERLDDVLINPLFKNCNGNFKKYLDRELVWYGESSKDRLSAAKSQKLYFEKILNEVNPCLVVLANGQHASELIFKDLIRERKIPLTFLERGCLPKSWHLDDLGITAGTSIALKKLEEINVENTTHNIELFKSYYLNGQFTWWQQPESNNQLNIRERFNVSKDTKLILFLNQLDNDTSNFLYSPLFNNNHEAFSWFLKGIKDENCFVIAKKHPWFSGNENEFSRAFEKQGVEGVWIDDISLFDCLEQTDYVAAVNSTVVFEAMLYEKPVLQLGKSILSNKEIVYEIKGKDDFQTVNHWLESLEFKDRVERYNVFMSYMIKNELSFFSKECIKFGFNDSKLFLNWILSRLDDNRKGRKLLSFLEKEKRVRKQYLVQRMMRKIAKKSLNLIKKYVK
ncbi:hypothetical protein [Pontimicrobium sp. IMCC45349]|uniref:capsular polysaccharide export protein, LipB/KpsS family n=1 Tax=Pontimicrobium sp. IMCC45349 TaxID=3391574 RepID=UPI0039A3B73E